MSKLKVKPSQDYSHRTSMPTIALLEGALERDPDEALDLLLCLKPCIPKDLFADLKFHLIEEIRARVGIW